MAAAAVRPRTYAESDRRSKGYPEKSRSAVESISWNRGVLGPAGLKTPRSSPTPGGRFLESSFRNARVEPYLETGRDSAPPERSDEALAPRLDDALDARARRLVLGVRAEAGEAREVREGDVVRHHRGAVAVVVAADSDVAEREDRAQDAPDRERRLAPDDVGERPDDARVRRRPRGRGGAMRRRENFELEVLDFEAEPREARDGVEGVEIRPAEGAADARRFQEVGLVRGA